MVDPLLVRAARREPTERTPVWFMRQAGRSLPEYRAVRERHAFFEINQSAELTAEVTLQPVRRHNVDAAVMFADIMTPVLAMGVDVEFVEGVGPVVREPIDRIHWAGTETATRWMGYFDGAVQSGKRAAAEVMRSEGSALATAAGARAAQASRVVPG